MAGVQLLSYMATVAAAKQVAMAWYVDNLLYLQRSAELMRDRAQARNVSIFIIMKS